MTPEPKPAAINSSHKYAVFEYLDNVSDPYYIGKRFISRNGQVTETTKIVATADTIEECQKHMPPLTKKRIMDWYNHSLSCITHE